MLMTDSVMRAKQPRLQVREGDVDYWQVCIGSLGVAIEHQEFVRVALPRQIIVAPPTIGAHDSALCHILLHKLRKYLGVAVWHDTQPQSTRVIRSLGCGMSASKFWKYDYWLCVSLTCDPRSKKCRSYLGVG